MFSTRGPRSPEPGILSAVGNTPLVRLAEAGQRHSAQILAKLESRNPGGSSKDRIARYVLQEALRTRRLGPKGTVVEFSSGNTGISLAMVCAALGLNALIVTSAKISAERLALLHSYGAVTVPAQGDAPPDDPEHGLSKAQRLALEEKGFYFDQFHNPLNPQAHYLSTGPEIWRQSAGRIDVLVAAMGTGGTISGAARFLKERNPDLLVVGVDALGSILADYIRGRPPAPPRAWALEGMGSDMVSRALDRTVIDRVVTVPDQEAFRAAREAARNEGISIGGSAGAALWAARLVAKEREPGCRIVFIAADAGERYKGEFFAPGAWAGTASGDSAHVVSTSRP